MAIHIHVGQRRVRDANSPEYDRALAKAREASRVFTEAQRAYRAREIGDQQYLAARRVWEESQKEFDRARGESTDTRDGLFSDIVELLQMLWQRHASRDGETVRIKAGWGVSIGQDFKRLSDDTEVELLGELSGGKIKVRLPDGRSAIAEKRSLVT